MTPWASAASPPSPRERQWAPLFGVLVTILVVAFGGYVVAGSSERPDHSEPRVVEVLPGVAVALPPGWARAGPVEAPIGAEGEVLRGVRLTRATGTMDLFTVDAFDGAPEELVGAYVEEVLRPAASQLGTAEALDPFMTEEGLSGARGTYLGSFAGIASPIEGEVAAVISSAGPGVVFDGWAGEGQLVQWIEDIRRMVMTSEVG